MFSVKRKLPVVTARPPPKTYGPGPDQQQFNGDTLEYVTRYGDQHTAQLAVYPAYAMMSSNYKRLSAPKLANTASATAEELMKFRDETSKYNRRARDSSFKYLHQCNKVLFSQ
jgi:hypothetical protein